jgi:hypothetical protein
MGRRQDPWRHINSLTHSHHGHVSIQTKQARRLGSQAVIVTVLSRCNLTNSSSCDI